MRMNRNRCQHCRFKKCLAVGMSRDGKRSSAPLRKKWSNAADQPVAFSRCRPPSCPFVCPPPLLTQHLPAPLLSDLWHKELNGPALHQSRRNGDKYGLFQEMGHSVIDYCRRSARCALIKTWLLQSESYSTSLITKNCKTGIKSQLTFAYLISFTDLFPCRTLVN